MTTFWVLLVCVKEPLSQWCQGGISKHKEQELVPGSLPGGLETLARFEIENFSSSGVSSSLPLSHIF